MNLIPPRPTGLEKAVLPFCNGRSLDASGVSSPLRSLSQACEGRTHWRHRLHGFSVGELHGVYQGDLGYLFGAYKRATPACRWRITAPRFSGTKASHSPT